MRKITDFIVNKRYLIIVIFLILTVISAIVSTKVNINHDIQKYLPKTSETKQGLDIMEEEFKGTETSSFNIMFKDLKDEEKEDVYNYLSKINNVDEVEYDSSEKYNKDDYTLYVVNVKDKEDSKKAADIFNNVQEKYKDYEFYTSGSISDKNSPVVEVWILVFAVVCAMIILIIMCDSYFEAFLFLGTILIAVVLNKGSNIIFDSVSNITESISAILQLALSMDYSIMLMNRYNQEKEKEKDKIKAMKEALYNAFQAISSSSVTTIVGLAVLVFMSFTIGKDLGFVLAKGVLFSLISIFFVLPGLILLFDKLIEKTKKKKKFSIKMNLFGKINYKLRYILVPLFLVIFVGSFLLKSNLGILYSNTQMDEVSKVFDENNQIALIYKNEDEDKINKIVKEIENDEGVDEVLSYSNTINEKLPYDKLNEKINDLGADTDIEDYLLKILYYHYYNKDIENKVSFKEFTTFLKSEIYDNEEINDKINDEVKANVEKLENFITKEEINKKRSKAEISSVLDIDKDTLDKLFILYSTKHDNIKISLGDFIKFINKDVLTDKEYSSQFDKDARQSLDTLSKFTNKSKMQTKMTSKQMAELFGIDKNTVDQLYQLYILEGKIDTKLSLAEFSNFVLDEVITNKTYSSSFDKDTVAQIKLLSTFSNKDIINKKMNAKGISSLFGIDEDMASKVLLLKYMNIDSGEKLSITDFIKKTKIIKENTNYLDGVDVSSIISLYDFANNTNNINTTQMDKEHLKYVLDNISKNLVDTVYTVGKLPENTTFTIQGFVKKTIEILSQIPNADVQEIGKLQLIEKIIDEAVSGNKEQYTASKMAKVLGQNKDDLYKLYALISFENKTTSNWNATPYEFAKIIIQNSSNSEIKENLDKNTLSKLKQVIGIMESSKNNTKYTYAKLAEFIGADKNTIKSVYALYKSGKTTLKLTPYTFTKFILENQNNELLKGRLSKETLDNLKLVKSVLEGVLNDKKYTSKEISKLLGIENEKVELLYGLYSTKYVNKNRKVSFREFIDFLLKDVITNEDYASNFDDDKILKLNTVDGIMKRAVEGTKYTASEIMAIVSVFTDDIDSNTIDILYIYYGSQNEYNDKWELTVEEFINYLNNNILKDERFDDFIKQDMRDKIISSKQDIDDAKKMLVSDKYSRMVVNTSFDKEGDKTFSFIKKVKDLRDKNLSQKSYVIGDSLMAYEMTSTFNDELNFITILTMVAIFIVVAITFKSIIIPLILVLIIQSAVFLTMGILSVSGQSVYFLSIIIVQSILMGATIDYAILYTSYYLENRRTMNIKDAVIESYNKSIHTILTSSSILIIVTFIVANFASAIAAKICKTISEGTLCSTILILVFLPAILALADKLIIKKDKKSHKEKEVLKEEIKI